MAYTTRNVARDARSNAGFSNKTAAGRPRGSSQPQTPDASRPGRGVKLGVDFESFAASLRRSLVPASPLECVLTDRLILAAWRLQLASAFEFDAALAGDDLPSVSQDTLDAEVTLDRSLERLEASRADRLSRDSRTASEISEPPCDADYSNEWTSLPEDVYPLVEEMEDEDDDDDVTSRWQDRLVFDFNVSESSPVVKGTWITVGHVVSMVVDGWTWNDILRTHPELTEDDIRTCLAYTVEQDGCEDF